MTNFILKNTFSFISLHDAPLWILTVFLVLDLAIVFHFLKDYPKRQKGILFASLALLILELLYLSRPAPGSVSLISRCGLCLLLNMAFLQDFCSFYFSRFWFFWGGLFLVFSCYGGLLDSGSVRERLLCGAVMMLVSLPFVLKRKMGSADFWFLGLFGFVLSFKRMVICLLFSCVIGLVWGLVQKKNSLVPFVSCLCLGALTSLLWGYAIWFFLIRIQAG